MLFSPALPMHIPDGFLSLFVLLICWLATILILSLAISKTNQSLGERQVPLMGVMAAFIFAAQMINFPVLGGTSGHLLGGALAAITLGPWAGMIVMTAVIAVQALLFQDGGLTVMGANILNMGLIPVIVGYGFYRAVLHRNRIVKLVFIGIAAWLSVVSGALFTALQIWLSGHAQLGVIVPAMLFVHVFIGIGEALITVAALSFIMRTRPDLLGEDSESAKAGGGWIVTGLAVAFVVVLLSPLASSDPDGLERVAIDLGFMNSSKTSLYNVLPDYSIPFLGKTSSSTIAAGALGALVILGLVYAAGRFLQKKKV